MLSVLIIQSIFLYSIALANTDGDGYDDIILGIYDSNNVVIMNNGDRAFLDPILYQVEVLQLGQFWLEMWIPMDGLIL